MYNLFRIFYSITYCRVLAKNAAGCVSDFSEESEPISCRDEVIPPRVEFDSRLTERVVVKCGEMLKIEAYIAGKFCGVPVIYSRKDYLCCSNEIDFKYITLQFS